MKIRLHRKGFVLASVVALSVIFIIIVIPMIAWSVNELFLTAHSFMSLRALNLADAGADLAVWDIIHNNAQFTGWSGTNPKTTTIYSFTDSNGTSVGDIVVSALNTASNQYLVTSTGYVPSIADTKAKKIVKVKAFPRPLFNNGIFGYSAVALSGNTVVDSYNSNNGPYSIATAGTNGDIGSNGSLTLADNALVKGDLFVGPSGSVAGNIPGRYTGETVYSGNDVEPESVTLPGYFTGLPNLGNYTVAGNQTPTLPTNNYFYENISVSGGSAVLTISANSHVYVRTNFTISGQAKVITGSGVEFYVGGTGSFAGQGIVNSTGVPNDLRIYGLSASTNLSYTGLSDFYGAIYAPESTVYLGGNAAYFGAIVGGNVTETGNVAFHYDEALAQNGPYDGYDIAYWQET